MDAQEVIVLASARDDARRLWLRLFCRDQGVVQAQAFGVKGSSRRFSGGLSPTMWGRAWGAPSRGKLRLSGFELCAEHAPLRTDPFAFAGAAYACELAGALLAPGQADVQLFDALQETLRALSGGSFAGAWLRYWEIALLSQQGWVSAPGRCSECSAPGREFLQSAGHWRCPRHLAPGTRAYPAAAVSTLASLHASWLRQHRPPNWLIDGRFVEMAPADRAALRTWCWRWIDHHLASPLKSRGVLLELAGGEVGKSPS